MIEAMPEINEDQLKMIQKIANSQFNRVVFTIPDSSMDTPDIYAGYFETQKILDHLVSLGLVDNVTEDSKDLLDAMTVAQATNSRAYRVFKITTEGVLMFDATLSDNRPN